MTRGLLRHTTANLYADLQVIHVRALVNNSNVKNNKCTNVKTMFLHTICHKSDMFRSIFITCLESPNINKTYINTDGLVNTLKFVYKMFVDTVTFICSGVELVYKMRCSVLPCWLPNVYLKLPSIREHFNEMSLQIHGGLYVKHL